MVIEDEEAPLRRTSAALMCDVCGQEPSKYKCPRCACRSCSLPCSKKHKIDTQCTGERDNASFDVTKRLADFTAATAAADEHFLEDVKNSVQKIADVPVPPNAPHVNCDQSVECSSEKNSDQLQCNNSPPQISNDVKEGNQRDKSDAMQHSDAALEGSVLEQQTAAQQENSKAEDEIQSKQQNGVESPKMIADEENEPERLSSTLYFLRTNARRRRIFLKITPGKEENGSRHERFSDTIFWTIRLVFRHEICDDGNKRVVDYTYTVNNIPENIAVATLVRQFIKPKKIGPVVNREDLDAEKMLPFQNAGMERLMAYMPVPVENKQRFYVVDMSKTILDNMRNRLILDHPTFIVTLDDECNDFVMLSEQEAMELQEERRHHERSFRGGRGRGGFRNFYYHRGFHRGGLSRDENGQVNGGYDGGFSPKWHGRGRGGFHNGNKRSSNEVEGDTSDGWHEAPPWKRRRGSQRGYRGNCDFQRWCERKLSEISRVELEAAEDARRCFSGTGAAGSRDRLKFSPSKDPVIESWAKAVDAITRNSAEVNPSTARSSSGEFFVTAKEEVLHYSALPSLDGTVSTVKEDRRPTLPPPVDETVVTLHEGTA